MKFVNTSVNVSLNSSVKPVKVVKLVKGEKNTSVKINEIFENSQP